MSRTLRACFVFFEGAATGVREWSATAQSCRAVVSIAPRVGGSPRPQHAPTGRTLTEPGQDLHEAQIVAPSAKLGRGSTPPGTQIVAPLENAPGTADRGALRKKNGSVLGVTDSPHEAGADTLPNGLELLAETFAFSRRGRPLTGFGHYASVIDIGGAEALALATDTIGTKALVAQAIGKFDTVGIDCVAMNANDIVCVGAEPIAMVDCMAVEAMDEAFLAEIAVGLREGARQARISIPGGETARVPEMIRGVAEGKGFDLGGTCVGLVATDRILTGERAAPSDALIGFASSGIHSNGFTLARHVFADAGWDLGRHVEDFGRTLGEELIEPTAMYVDLALALLEELDMRALFHLTGDGFLNLRRLEAEVGFAIEVLPETPAIFATIQRLAGLDQAAMHAEYNMGVGFCAVVPEAEADRAIAIGQATGVAAWRLGTATPSPAREVSIHTADVHLRSDGKRFESV